MICNTTLGALQRSELWKEVVAYCTADPGALRDSAELFHDSHEAIGSLIEGDDATDLPMLLEPGDAVAIATAERLKRLAKVRYLLLHDSWQISGALFHTLPGPAYSRCASAQNT